MATFGSNPGGDLPPVDTDPYVCCSFVSGLNKDNFYPYVYSKDATFVMFYDPKEPMSEVAKQRIREAAPRTNRASHQYAAVNCSCEKELCAIQGIRKAPAYQLFSRGSLVNYITEVESMQAKNIRNFVETSPVIYNAGTMSCNN